MLSDTEYVPSFYWHSMVNVHDDSGSDRISDVGIIPMALAFY